MPEHGEFDLGLARWFCGYWMNESEWKDVHDYKPGDSESNKDVIDEADDV